jgi:hypothetical protein
LNKPINWPSQVRERLRKEVEEICSNIIEEKSYNEVIDDIGERVEYRSLKTMRWDSFLDLAESEWGL